MKATNSKMLRVNNKSKILWKLYNSGAMSRIALAKVCNLTGAAITIIVKQMLDDGTLIENGQRLQRNGQGRKEVLLDINYDKYYACNVNIEKDKIHISLCSLKKVLKEEILIINSNSNLIDKIIDSIEKITTEYKESVLGIGVGVIGTVDENSGILVNSYGLFADNYNIKAVLEKKFNKSVYISNNVRSHAKAIIDEKNRDFLYIKHGPGLGSAVVVQGKILKGFNNRAGEIGHTFASLNDRSLEYYISEQQLLSYFKNQTTEINQLYELYGKNSQITEKIDECIEKLVMSIVNAVIIIDSQKIIVSGGLFDNQKTFDAFIRKYNSLGYQKNYMLEKVPKAIKIKSIANSKLVFNKKFFNF